MNEKNNKIYEINTTQINDQMHLKTVKVDIKHEVQKQITVTNNKNDKPSQQDLNIQVETRTANASNEGKFNDTTASCWKQNQTELRRNNNVEVHTKKSISEREVGINEYVSDTPGFTGVLKSRFSDFQVNEIDVTGKVLYLTNLTIPQPTQDKKMSQIDATKILSDIISVEQLSEIKELFDAVRNHDKFQPIQLDATELSKENRTKIHKALSTLFGSELVSCTIGIENNTKKVINIDKMIKNKSDSRNSWLFPGEFVHFLVHKENLDTIEVAVGLANRLNLRPSQVNYCGTKDKRAKTTQKFCIKRRTPSQIVAAAKSMRNVHVGNFQFSNDVLKLGNLNGNRFRIAIRHLSGEQGIVENALKEIRNNGFINYYGLQRFGNCSEIPTYKIGIALLKCDYKLACELILMPRSNDSFLMQPIRKLWWETRDAAKAASMLHSEKLIEKKLLDGLIAHGPNDYASALRKIPRNMLLLYPHAFQSLIFNLVASRRVKEFGLKLVPGDLVYRTQIVDISDLTKTSSSKYVETTSNEKNDEVNKSGKINELSRKVSAEEMDESEFKRKVKAITNEDIANRTYTLFDLILPLPGHDVKYPLNESGQWYEEILAEYGLSSEKLHHRVKTFSMAGAYRKVFIKPEDMTWEFREYNSPNQTLIESDWKTVMADNTEVTLDTISQYKALVIEFNLPTSAYATMMLRELLKSDTSVENQIQIEQEEIKKCNDKKNQVVVGIKRKTDILNELFETDKLNTTKMIKTDKTKY